MGGVVTGQSTPARLERLFAPRSIALVGASERSTWARMIVAALERTRFSGRVELVNGRGGEVFGRTAVAKLTDIGDPVDAAYVMVPATLVLDAIREGHEAGIRNFVVLTSGFAEAGDQGRDTQDQLRRLALENELAIIGPNTMGFINATDGVTLMPNSLPGLPRVGSVGLVTQSGALAGATLHYCQTQRIGVSKVIALGNEAVIGVADVIDYLASDPHTSVIAVMMEAIRSPEAFIRAAGLALEAGKPIVALKAGRTEAGARVAAAHTGAMVDDDRVVDAVFRQLGVIRVPSIEALMTTAFLLTRVDLPLAGNRLAVLGISGGACNIIADRAEDERLRLEPFNPRTTTSLQPLVSNYGVVNNPLDVTGAAVNQPDLFGNIIRAVTRDADADVVLVQHDVPGAHSLASDKFTHVLRAAADSDRVPTLVVGSLGQGEPFDDDRFPVDLSERIMPGGMDLAVAAIGRAAWWSERQRRGSRELSRAERMTLPGHAPGEIWGEERARTLLAAAGFPLVPATVAATVDDALLGARQHGFPVALKAVLPAVAHKSDIGGVELGVGSPEELRTAAKRITERLSAAGHRSEAFLVSPMRPQGVELIVGVVRKPLWGQVLAVGFGGVWAEVLSDTALRVLPVDGQDVRDMLSELRGASLLRAPRGLPPVDVDAVVDAVLALATLAESLSDDLESIEVNPLWVHGHQVEGLDALVTWQSTPNSEMRQEHGRHS
ncbi:acetate--CoA ligase family protein [Dactylosporangium sp. AC04546]|uniref:acetate--CoA ligase family protein n=1 Tax=Dactylosporangium sp. AC04546 TaxID=2862460 RepID=UPI001EE04204|nr:acetate--CoA ligase family protein [Dactylosporangium sp. AC04546]WVK86924.1 acetate--CoA ligase family protein [Dactylosporangium sp. AC04546]